MKGLGNGDINENNKYGIQHRKVIAGEVVKSRSIHLINFGSDGQVQVLKSATALILKP